MAALQIHRAQVALAAALFATGGAAIKWTTLSGLQVAGLRSGLAAAALALFVPAWRRHWTRASLVVGAAYAVTMILFVVANKLTTAANAIFLQATAPLYVMLLAPRLLGESPARGDRISALLLALGMALFFLGHDLALLREVVAVRPKPRPPRNSPRISSMFEDPAPKNGSPPVLHVK